VRQKIALLATIALSACASSSQTFAPDGRQAYVLNCSGLARTWGACLEKAGDLCGSAGYDVLDRDGENGFIASGGSSAAINGNRSAFYGSGSSGFLAGSTHGRSMLIACKKPA
jgi:hypothetical protein